MELPPVAIHNNLDFYPPRTGCVHYEKPFLYLILGRMRRCSKTGAGNVETAPIVLT
jgi:hypothetical protein